MYHLLVLVAQYFPEHANFSKSVRPAATLFFNVFAWVLMLSDTVANDIHLPDALSPAMLLFDRATADVPRPDSNNAIAAEINGFICFSCAYSKNICAVSCNLLGIVFCALRPTALFSALLDRKSTRLNSSHCRISRMPSSA